MGDGPDQVAFEYKLPKQPKKTKQQNDIIFLVLLLLLLVVGIGIGIGGSWMYRKIQHSNQPVPDTVQVAVLEGQLQVEQNKVIRLQQKLDSCNNK